MENTPHILVVHVTLSEREKITAHAEGSHARVEFVQTPGEAVRRLAISNDFDAVFMGIETPDQEYCAVLDAVRNNRPATAVVVISPSDDVPFYLSCLRHGVFDYIVRPVDWKEFGRIYDLTLHRRAAFEVAKAQTA
ncbi:MAG: response regulator [Acidobacteriia bacterium]|nr:response regulator [Terriglobia bacterium]